MLHLNKFKLILFIENKFNLGSPQGVLFGREAKQFLIAEKANPSNNYYWANDEAAGEKTCVFDGSVEVNKFNRGEPIDHYLPFVNHANKGSNNVSHVWIKVRLFYKLNIIILCS